MNIYICTSTKNLEAYRALRDELTAAGHHVLDWTSLLPPQGPDFERRKDEDPGGHIFLFCSNACATADLVVHIGPSGTDVAFELGIAYAVGVPVWSVPGPGRQQGLMLRGGVRRWFASLEELCLALTRWKGW